MEEMAFGILRVGKDFTRSELDLGVGGVATG